jgi:hypothetical protein
MVEQKSVEKALKLARIAELAAGLIQRGRRLTW